MNVSYAHGGTQTALRDKDRELFKIIETFIGDHGYSPSLRELRVLGEYSSTSMVKWALERLKKAGAISFVAGAARTIVVIDGGVCA